RGPNPDQVFTWLLQKFGGERAKLKGQIDAVRYRADGFSDMWILVQRGDAAPSEGRAIDHIGWRSPGSLTTTISELKAKGVTVTSEPRPLTPAALFWVAPRVQTQSSAPPSTRNGEWPAYTADLRGSKYSALDQINGTNFNHLEVAWRFKTDNLGTRPEYKLEGTPLMVKGV